MNTNQDQIGYGLAIKLSPDGNYITSYLADDTIQIWDVEDGGALVQTLTGHTDWVYSLFLTPTERLLPQDWMTRVSNLGYRG